MSRGRKRERERSIRREREMDRGRTRERERSIRRGRDKRERDG